MDLPDDSPTENRVSIWSVYKIPLILGFLSLFCAAISLALMIKASRDARPIEFSHASNSKDVSNLSSSSANLATILVDIEGSVVHPGVVRLPDGSRVEDAIIASGGLKADADTDYIEKNLNKAMKVADGMKLYIPRLNEDQTSYNTRLSNSMDKTSHNLSPLLRSSDGGSSQNGGVVSVNLASQSELDQLPGVGPVTATKIIDNRPYMRLEDLVTKKAIGPSLFEKLKNMLSL